MKLGFFTMPIHPLDKDWRKSLREDREAFILADKLGFTEGYVGEHATDKAENITSCAVFIASLIDATKKIKLGTGTINMPNSHPAATAAQIAMLDHMLDGRFIFGISPGGLLSDAEAFGNLDADRNAMFLEAINAVLAIWAGAPPYNIDGKYWKVKIEQQLMPEIGQGYLPKPLQKPHPPIHISISSPDSVTAKLAGAKGWGIISGPVAPLYAVASHWQAYREARRQAGKTARSEDWRLSRLVIVAPTDAEAEERVYGERASNRYYCTYMRTALATAKRLYMIKPRADMPDEECTPEAIMQECVIHGSPRTVLDKLVALRERVGPFGTLLQIGLDWGGPNEAWERDGMRLLAQDVMPKFGQHVTAQAAE
jgi:alkanesulfonate monooxygenase SsuD/methylene tetrahydromethanopterin reductase-like flavin-dependent oxidoreductase (luciferase family)